MNLWPPLIFAAVAAIWYYLSGGNPDVKGSVPGSFPSAPSGGASFAQPGTTGQPSSNSLNVSPPAITVQPGTSSSGVPGTAGQVNNYTNTTPGPTTAIAPFQPRGNPIPLGGANHPNYGSNRNVLDLANLLKNLNPFNIPGSSTAPRKGGCSGGCGGCGSNPSNGGGCQKAGSCAGAAPQPTTYPAPNQLINIPAIPTMYVAQSPMTLASQMANLSLPYMNPFTSYLNTENILDTNNGGVPAAPTHGGSYGSIPSGPNIAY